MPRYEPLCWYENALYYDIVFDADTAREASFLQAAHRRYGRTRGRRMLEPACGSGRLVAVMARRGYSVTGFDISASMLDFARDRLRRRGLKGRLVEGRMENFEFRQKFDIAHCLVSTFKYLPDEDSARSHLRCVARALKPGGIYVLGLHLTDYRRRSCERERWVGKRRGTEVVCNIQGWPPDRRRRRERVRARLVVKRRGTERRFETHWQFRTYSLRQLRTLLRSVPELEQIETYDFNCDIRNPLPFDGAQNDNVLILRRRGIR
ncbi:MAG: class I SAM-dependent methyltransferase [Phycisphaerales bacterium]|nr:MAG: class I SAM-dependent methyltransferase [Phycisphaerales bacterium]